MMHVRGEKRGSLHQVRIVDAEALRSVLRRIVEEEEYSTHRQAATFLRIGQTTFTRLLNGTTNQFMRFDTYCSIREALSGHAIEFGLITVFEDSVLPWEGRQIRGQYESWLDGELDRLRETHSFVTELFAHPEYHEQIEKWLQQVTLREHLPREEDKRHWLALYRALEPLGNAKATYGVERSWQELHEAGHLRPFLRAALERERIMLERERDLERINARRLPDEALAWLAEPDEPTPEEIAEERAALEQILGAGQERAEQE